MGKRRQYSDQFRADAVLMLEAAGYPGKKGALSSVARHLTVPDRTLSRWYRQEQAPPPDKLVSEKRLNLVAELTELLGLTIGAAKHEVHNADYRELATAIGILTDKIQLLTGKATERVEQSVTVSEKERQRRVNAIISDYNAKPPTH